MDITEFSLPAAIAVFLSAAAVIGFAGTRLTRLADTLAGITGLGGALFGGIFLGASTSLPGIVASLSAASAGHADLAFSNAIGGIAAQTAFLAIADMFYRRANLEHSAASVNNMMQCALLLILLMAVLLLIDGPEIDLAQVHPGSAAMILIYALGLRMIGRSRRASTWKAVQTPETEAERRDRAPRSRYSTLALWMGFWMLALLVAAAGWLVARAAIAITRTTGLSETIAGGLFMAVATSLPELITSIAAVRQGALSLAVGNIIGGNSFEVLFLPCSDVAYREGSIYHAIAGRQVYIIALAAILNAILLLGLLRREKHGIANIGFESFLVLVLYVGGFLTLFFF